MTTEMVFRNQHVASVFGGDIKNYFCEDEDEKVIESNTRKKFREFEKEIKDKQKSGVKFDGFIVFETNVYQVYAVNGMVKKITGHLAKEVKRLIKAAL